MSQVTASRSLITVVVMMMAVMIFCPRFSAFPMQIHISKELFSNGVITYIICRNTWVLIVTSIWPPLEPNSPNLTNSSITHTVIIEGILLNGDSWWAHVDYFIRIVKSCHRWAVHLSVEQRIVLPFLSYQTVSDALCKLTKKYKGKCNLYIKYCLKKRNTAFIKISKTLN